jgi:outer membrane protein assembly factor BamE (lipoprotein component of BamABCDE complex)
MRVGRFFTAALLALALAACQPIVRNHGYMPNEEDLALLAVGVDTRDTVASSIGTPSAAGLFTESGYYYVRSRWETLGPRAPQEVDRQVLAVTFDEEGVLENIERFTLEDGRVVALSRRVTATSIRNISFIRQLLGGIGRLNLEEGID